MKRAKIDTEYTFGKSKVLFNIRRLTFSRSSPFRYDTQFYCEFEYNGLFRKTCDFGLKMCNDLSKIDDLQNVTIPLVSSCSVIRLGLNNTAMGIPSPRTFINLSEVCKNYLYVKDFYMNPYILRLSYSFENYGPEPENLYPFYALFSPQYQFQPIQLIILKFLDCDFLLKVMTKVSRTMRSLIQKRIEIDSVEVDRYLTWRFMNNFLLSQYRIHELRYRIRYNELYLPVGIEELYSKFTPFLKKLEIECKAIEVGFIQSIIYFTPTLEFFVVNARRHYFGGVDEKITKMNHSSHNLRLFQFEVKEVFVDPKKTSEIDQLLDYVIGKSFCEPDRYRFPHLYYVQIPDNREINNHPFLRRSNEFLERFKSHPEEQTLMNQWMPPVTIRLYKNVARAILRVEDVKTFSFMNIVFQVLLVHPRLDIIDEEQPRRYSIMIWLMSDAYVKLSLNVENHENSRTSRSCWMYHDSFRSFHSLLNDTEDDDGFFEISLRMKLKEILWTEADYKDVQRKRNLLLRDSSRLRFSTPYRQRIAMKLRKFDRRRTDNILVFDKSDIELSGTLFDLRVMCEKEDAETSQTSCRDFYVFYVFLSCLFDSGVIVADVRMTVQDVCSRSMKQKDFSRHFFSGSVYVPQLSRLEQLEMPDAELVVDLEVLLRKWMPADIYNMKKAGEIERLEEWVKMYRGGGGGGQKIKKKENYMNDEDDEEEEEDDDDDDGLSSGKYHLALEKSNNTIPIPSMDDISFFNYHNHLSEPINRVKDSCVVEIPYGEDHLNVVFTVFDVMEWQLTFYEKRGRNGRGGIYLDRRHPGDWIVILEYRIRLLGTDFVMRASQQAYFRFRGWGFPEIQYPKVNSARKSVSSQEMEDEDFEEEEEIEEINNNNNNNNNSKESKKFLIEMDILGVIPSHTWLERCRRLVSIAEKMKEDDVSFRFVLDNPYTTTQVGVEVSQSMLATSSSSSTTSSIIPMVNNEEEEEEDYDNHDSQDSVSSTTSSTAIGVTGEINLCGIPFTVEFFPRGRDGRDDIAWIAFCHQLNTHFISCKFIVRVLDYGDGKSEYVKEVKNGGAETPVPLCPINTTKTRWKFYVKLIVHKFKEKRNLD